MSSWELALWGSSLKTGSMIEPVFVGRESEIRELQECLASVIAGNGKTVLVSGEAGTGKTRLVNEFLKLVGNRELTIMVGWCLSDASIPYFPFIEAFKDSVRKLADEPETSLSKRIEHEFGIAQKALTKTMRVEVKPLVSSSPTVWKDATFATVGNALRIASELRPLLLFIDDLHWADSASLALLHYLSRVLSNQKVFIVATFRSEELHPNADGKPHPLVEAARLLRREDLLEEINLTNLSRLNVAKVAEQIARGPLDPEFVAKLAAESLGNPLFVIESMRMLLENKSLVQKDGYLQLATGEIGIPQKVRDIILRRLDSLKPDQRRMLDLASVIGEKFNPTLLGAALTTDAVKTLEELNGISAATSLVHSDEVNYRFDHAKSREVLYSEIPSALRREYHAKIAATIENASAKADEIRINDLAYHYAQAAKNEKALRYSIAAGEDALARFSNDEAAKYFEYVLEIVSNKPEYLNERIKGSEGLGDALLAKGMFEKAGEIFEKLSDVGSGATRSRALRKSLEASFWRGDMKHAVELAGKSEEYGSLDRLEYARLLIWRGRVVGFSGDPEAALRDLEQALRISEEQHSLMDAAQTLIQLSAYYGTKGKIKKAIAATRRAIALCHDLEDLRGQMEMRMFEGTVFFTCGLFKEAMDDYDKSMKLAERLGAPNEITMTSLYSSFLLEVMGNLKAALAVSLQTLQYSERTDSGYLRFNNYQMLTRLYAKLGDLQHAEEFHGKLMKLFDMISQKGTKLAHATGLYAKALFSAAREQWEQANSQFEESLQILKNAVFSNMFEPIIKADYASCLAKQGCKVEAKKLSEESIKLREEVKSRLEPGEVQTFLMAKRETVVEDDLEVRLDVVNISTEPALLLKLESLIPTAFGVKLLPSKYVQQGDSIDFQEKKFEPFEVETIKIVLQPKREGVFNLTPSASYQRGDSKETQSFLIDPIKIIVRPKIVLEPTVSEAKPSTLLKFEFKTDSAKKIFDFLLSAFVQDYMRRRLPLEWSGWRTLMEIVRHTDVSRHSIYGDERSRGRAISELEQRGLVEARIFPKERGRGGKITKLRVFYEKDIVKRRIDQEVSAPDRKNIPGKS